MTNCKCREVFKVVRQFGEELTSAIYVTGVQYTPGILTHAPAWALQLGYGITSFINKIGAIDFYHENNESSYVNNNPNIRCLKVYRAMAIGIIPLTSTRVYPRDMRITEEILQHANCGDVGDLADLEGFFIDVPRPWPKGTIMSQSLVLLEQINPNN